MREREFQPAVYLLASQRNGTLYCGSTGDFVRRVWEHKEGVGSHFTSKYEVKQLVWFELHGEMGDAIKREYQIKQWRRAWKLRLIEDTNPTWRDLYPDII